MGDSYDDFLARHPGHDLVLEHGVKLHYLDEGEGEPVLMVHGNPSWSYYYRKLAEALSGDHRVIVPDHVGCGRSDKPTDDRYEYTLERRIRDLEQLVDHLKLDGGITLVVHDWGGAIGMGFAARHPEKIARLVILNTAAFHLPATKPFPWPLWLCRNTPLSAWLVRGLNAFCRGTAYIGCKQSKMPRAVRDAYLAPYDSWANRIGIHRFVQDIPLRAGDRAYDLVTFMQDRLALFVDTPMLIGWGLRDFVFDRHFLAEWECRFPQAEVHRFPDAGHYVLEDAADELVPRIVEFLARHPAMRAVV
jgi:cis-3-alkyl-4-acyloxetan-2-one decarboxylase